MLIYSSKKEFIGIDEKDLRLLGFDNLANLKSEATDFADLFVKTPGHIHNFKHVHWIDFIACADSTEDSQAIINVNGKKFKCKISIENLFLAEDPSSKSYIVYLNNLRELSNRESQTISGDIAAKPTPSASSAFVAPQIVDDFNTPEEKTVQVSRLQEDPYETPLDVDFDSEESDFELDTQGKEDIDEMLDVGDLSFDEEEADSELQTKKSAQEAQESFDNGYRYDPNLASDELGLPLDLIEEFIQDFIAQAKEFKPSIYNALYAGELDQVKILSHKLKGVAANLRIEDAFDALNTVNTSADSSVIQENLDTFYKIIAKLAGEEIVVEKEIAQEDEVEADSKSDQLDFKVEVAEEIATPVEKADIEDDDLYGDLLDIDDSEVPQKIDMPELADDEFLSTDVDMQKFDAELENIENIELLELDLGENEAMDEEFTDEIVVDFAEDSLPEEDEVYVEYSKESAAGEIGLDLEGFNELFEDYLSESDRIIAQIKSAIEKREYKICRQEALKLQGMSENMRLNSFSRELETLTHSTDENALNEAIGRVEKIISKISRTGA